MKRRTLRSIAIMILLAPLFVSAAPVQGPAAAHPGRSAGGVTTGSRGMGLILGRADPARKLHAGRLKAGRLAAAVDLSADLPPVGDQGLQNSCVGWALGYYFKSWWEKKEHPSWNLQNSKYRFSPSFIYNQINGGRDAGATIYDGLRLLETMGDCDIEEFTYDGDYRKQPDALDREAAGQYRIAGNWSYFFVHRDWGPYPLFLQNDLTPLKAWLNSGRPLVLGMPIYADFPDYRMNPANDYYVYDGYSEFHGGHAIFIAGYDDDANPFGATPDERGGFLAINSWGGGWNGDGRVWLSYRFVRECVAEAWVMEDRDSSPSLASVSPAEGGPGDTVTLNGDNLGAKRRSARVTFAGEKTARVASWKNGRITVEVPEGVKEGNIHVYVWDGERSNGKGFEPGPGSGTVWLMAEGATWPGFDEWVLVMNPNGEAAHVEVRFLTPEETMEGPRFVLNGESRTTVHVNDFVRNRDVSTVVTSTNGVTVCTERAMYINTADGKWGSHDTTGTTVASDVWYLAEGATWPGFDEWILVMNPNEKPVEVQLTFQTPAGEVPGPRIALAPGRRGSVHVNDFVPNADVATRVDCLTKDRGVVAERSMYVRTADGRLGSHCSLGSFEAGAGWGLPEGATWPGFEEWVLVQNPSDEGVGFGVYFLTPDGINEGPSGFIGPRKRVSIRVNDFVTDRDVSTIVLTEDEDQEVVVERSMYISTADGKRGAHNAVGSLYASKAWYLPEGCTLPGFDEWVLVMNPDVESPAYVRLTFMTPGGPVQGPSATLPPAGRMSFRVNDYVTGDVSTTVTSDAYVACERSMYMNTADGKVGAHGALGIMAGLLGKGSGSHAAALPAGDRPMSAWGSRYMSR